MTMALTQWRQAFGDLLGRYREVFRQAWAEKEKYASKNLRPEEAEFLPAALSLQETPVSPAPRVTMWLLIGFSALTVLWAVFGKIDIVASAQGKIVPGSRIKTIQPLETSVVKKIFVSDGQAVKAGQVLVELDATTAEAEVDKLTGDITTINLQAARANALLASLENYGSGKAAPVPPRLAAMPGVDSSRMVEAQRLLDAQYLEFRSKMIRIESDVMKREAELQSTQALVRKLEQTAPIASQRAQDYKRLVEANFVSQHGYLEREQARIEQEADLENQRSRTREIRASLLEVDQQKKMLLAETRRVALDSLNDAKTKNSSLRQDHIKADSRAQSMTLSSPVDGVVQQLAIHTVGGVVTPAQALMIVVPRDETLEVEAFLENKDIGFVNAGQEAAVKIETFEYTKFGTIPSTVAHVSNDAINDEKRGLIYSMRVKMANTSLKVENKLVNLSPGMAVTVEVKTGKRRVIEYFLSPLLQHADEGMKER